MTIPEPARPDAPDTPERATPEPDEPNPSERTAGPDEASDGADGGWRLTPDGPKGMLFEGLDLRAFGRRMGQASS